jgi:Zn-dependent peptidase ImmA (M78 family)
MSSGSGHVPFLPVQRIERDAENLLAEYSERTGKPVEVPIPVEDILELHLQLQFAIEDLVALLGADDVLGAIWFNERAIRIDTRLDPTTNPLVLGRYRFTVAHEVGHWRLHRHLYVEDASQGKLFDGRGRPAFVCRSNDGASVEWQANQFAAAMLMPKQHLIAAWKEWRNDLSEVALADLPPAATMSPRRPGDRRDDAEVRMDDFARPLAEHFDVSASAMRKRLLEVGLLAKEKGNSLFT